MGAARRILMLLLLLPILVMVLPIALLAIAAERVAGLYLRIRFRLKWGAARRALLVYSNSPHWKAYVEENWLPALSGRAVVLNWSERSSWRRTHRLEAAVFRHYTGAREFNPIAIIFSGWQRAEIIQFWQPFRDHHHGKGRPLREAESRLAERLGVSLPVNGLSVA